MNVTHNSQSHSTSHAKAPNAQPGDDIDEGRSSDGLLRTLCPQKPALEFRSIHGAPLARKDRYPSLGSSSSKILKNPASQSRSSRGHSKYLQPCLSHRLLPDVYMFSKTDREPSLRPLLIPSNVPKPHFPQSLCSSALGRQGPTTKGIIATLPALRQSHSEFFSTTLTKMPCSRVGVNPEGNDSSVKIRTITNLSGSTSLLDSPICLPPISSNSSSIPMTVPVLPPLSPASPVSRRWTCQSAPCHIVDFPKSNSRGSNHPAPMKHPCTYPTNEAEQLSFRQGQPQLSSTILVPTTPKTASATADGTSQTLRENNGECTSTDRQLNASHLGEVVELARALHPKHPSGSQLSIVPAGHNFPRSSVPAVPQFGKRPPLCPSHHIELNKNVLHSSSSTCFSYPPQLLSRIEQLESIVHQDSHHQLHRGDFSQFLDYHNSLSHGLHVTPPNIEQVILFAYGYPREDNDADAFFHDAPGLSINNVDILCNALKSHLQSVRKAAESSVQEVYRILSRHCLHMGFNISELEHRYISLVHCFCQTREQVKSRFRRYVQTRNWIENIATRQRRGCLTHRQNNVLRLWLFRNFSNPYPRDADKTALVADTSLQPTQVNNWLINARSRIWKPTLDVMSVEGVRNCFAGGVHKQRFKDSIQWKPTNVCWNLLDLNFRKSKWMAKLRWQMRLMCYPPTTQEKFSSKYWSRPS